MAASTQEGHQNKLCWLDVPCKENWLYLRRGQHTAHPSPLSKMVLSEHKEGIPGKECAVDIAARTHSNWTTHRVSSKLWIEALKEKTAKRYKLVASGQAASRVKLPTFQLHEPLNLARHEHKSISRAANSTHQRPLKTKKHVWKSCSWKIEL